MHVLAENYIVAWKNYRFDGSLKRKQETDILAVYKKNFTSRSFTTVDAW